MDRVIEKRWGLPITPCQVEWHAGRRSRSRSLTHGSPGGAQVLVALSAARWAGEMSDHRKVARRVERSIEGNHGFVTVDTLKYLAMGGRIGKVQALLGGVLSFKRIVGIRDGETHPVDRPRTRRRAQRRIIELVRELAPIHQLHVSYSTGRDKAQPFGTSLPTSWSRNAPSSPRSVRSWVLTSVPIPSAWRQPREASRTTNCSQWERRLDRCYKEPGCSNRPKAREGGLETRRESLDRTGLQSSYQSPSRSGSDGRRLLGPSRCFRAAPYMRTSQRKVRS